MNNETNNELLPCPFCGSDKVQVWVDYPNNEEPEIWDSKSPVEGFENLYEIDCPECDFCSGKYLRPGHVIDKWNRRYAHAAAEMRWIPVSERLPDKDDWYQVTTTKTGEPLVMEANFEDGKFLLRCVTAWMEKVDPYTHPADPDAGKVGMTVLAKVLMSA